MTVVYCSNTGPATQIDNVRQISIVSQEDIERIALAMGISEFNPQLLGANLVVTGCNDFSYIPPSSRLQSDHVTTLIVDMKNYFCHQIGILLNVICQSMVKLLRNMPKAAWNYCLGRASGKISFG